ncbi:MAG: TFIIB-type zinc ribbon-containing protein [Ruminococcaceae bacterium]|jgi:DNA-directed RNA polymerase subunit RPC12/RpoP|nr:TFIIB-type zinc ribbon-containing protein [Oscillospiraceae bacterium]
MASIAEQKCPGCGATMRFDPQQGKLVCDYCGTVMDIPTDEPTVEQTQMEGFDFDSLNEQAVDLKAENLPVYNCVSCSAEVIAAPGEFSLTCPYCGNNIVLTDKISGPLRPNGMIPFKIDSKSLPAAMNRFYKNKALLPKNFFSQSTMSKVTGVYVPFWVFDGTMSGTARYRAQNTMSTRQGDYIVSETSHYDLVRDANLTFQDVPVDATGTVEDALMDSLEPFDMNEVKPFDMKYLAGFTASRFDLAKNDIAQRAEDRMRSSADAVLDHEGTAGYQSATRIGGSLKADLKAKYLLFPVYMFDIMHGGKSYSFAVNGQTGKVVGNLPISGSVSFQYFLKRAGAILAACVGASVAMYFMGR